MAGFGGIVSLLVKNAVKSAVKFEIAVDPIIAKLQTACPPKAELDKIINQKNQLTNSLTAVETSLNTLSKTTSTINKVVSGVDIAVKVIKVLPIPTSVPPGIGLPANVLTGLSNTLDVLSILIKESKGVLSQIDPSVQIITGILSTVKSKLSQLDGLLAGCLGGEFDEGSLWNPNKTYTNDDQVYLINPEGGKDYYIAQTPSNDSEINLDKIPTSNPDYWAASSEDSAKTAYFSNLGIVLSSPDNTGGSVGGTIEGETLEDRLKPNALNPIIYKDFTITLDSDAGNKFSFPSRRAIGTTNANSTNTNVGDRSIKITTPFSYSSSTQVLVDTVKFLIDQTDSLELARLAKEAVILEIETAEQYAKQLKIANNNYNRFKLFLNDTESLKLRSFNNLDTSYRDAIKGYERLASIDPTKSLPNQRIIEIEESYKKVKSKFDVISQIGGNPNSLGVRPSKTTSPPPSMSYTPFNGPGKIDGEVKKNQNNFYRYSSSSKRWSTFTPSPSPFSTFGTTNGETKILTRGGNTFTVKYQYRWNQTLYKWVQESSKVTNN
jgi:hypothetical protein